MNARADKTETGDIAALMRNIGTRARAAAGVLALADSARKEKALRAALRRSGAQSSAILQANAEDMPPPASRTQPPLSSTGSRSTPSGWLP
jgi:glutamate-5-semialdehyde dehydrogenase